MSDSPASVTAARPRVIITQGGLEAWLVLPPGRTYSVAELEAVLAANGVVVGIDREALARAAMTAPGERVLVARGTPSVPGVAAKLEVLIPLAPAINGPEAGDDGRVDYRSLQRFEPVECGQVLARKVPATEGTPGVRVTGEFLPAPRGKDTHLMPGRNVELSADRLELVARAAGLPRMDRNRISVMPILMVADVDYGTGHIVYQGTVLVRGNVLPGFRVESTEDVEIDGVIEGGVVEAAGSVVVRGGIRQGAKVSAGGHLLARFADSGSELSARGSIRLLDSSVHCTLVAGRHVQIGGICLGGVVRAGETVVVETLGAVSEAPTAVEIDQEGSSETLAALRAEIAQYEVEIAEITNLVGNFIANHAGTRGGLDIQGLTAQKLQMSGELAEAQERLAYLEAIAEGRHPPRVHVRGELFPGVVVTLNGTVWRAVQRYYDKTLTLDAGGIVGA